METTTGLPARRASTTSRQMASDATAEPPGLFTRKTIALTRSSFTAARNAAPIVSAPIAGPEFGSGPPRPLRPSRIGPCPLM